MPVIWLILLSSLRDQRHYVHFMGSAKLRNPSMNMTAHHTDFQFESIYENDLCWEQLNALHHLLNFSFRDKTDSFLYHPYSKRQPILRVLCRRNGELVASAAYFECFIQLGTVATRIGGVGLTCSALPGLGIGNACRCIVTREITEKMGTQLCISRVGERTVGSKTAQAVLYGVVEKPMVGRHSRSKQHESIAMYRTNTDEDILKQYFDRLKQLNEIRILDGEVF
jgi:hypothetical protein